MLETERLLLRRPSADDLGPWTSFLADPITTRYIGGILPPAGAWRNLCLFAGAWDIQGFSNFSIIEKATGRWIGRAGPWMPPDWHGAEIGWALARDAQGKGYATEAAARCLSWVFDDLGWITAVHVIHRENIASIAVALRLGSTFRNSLSGTENDIYTLSREAWRAGASKAS